MKEVRSQTPETSGQNGSDSRLATRNSQLPRVTNEGDASPVTRHPSLASRIQSVAKVVRTIIGAPDYDRYVAHVRQCHPDRVPLSRDEFARERLQARYNQPGNRCC